ncbi:MAG: hypothetical protein EPN47_13945 [Acidobacteria bacterium]|nr:MAG: hypothetical protein EPN47_13945 [Acidobacteriota bacterium]
MNPPFQGPRRVLAIDPSRRGFGFAVLDGPGALVDWGLKRAKGKGKYLERATALIRRYQPEVLVVERTSDQGCRRRGRALRVIRNLPALARTRHLRTRRISRRTVQRGFSVRGCSTKRQIAVTLSSQFPELAPSLPPVRKPWMSEDERMAIFDAVAFAYVSYETWRREGRALSLLSLETPLPYA